jgi:hypothetical protein
MLGILELLAPRGLDLNARIKLVRHQDKRYDLLDLARRGLLEIYQSYQAKPVFECDYIISFLGLENNRARLFGVYKVGARLPESARPVPSDYIYSDPSNQDQNGYFYELSSVEGFEDIKDRVVIDWGKSALAWHQWLTNKEVVEILPPGYVRDFPGYLDFVISFDELSAIIASPAANREWHRMLGAVAGVYLITDLATGKQYVGSAYGEAAILGRWKAYAGTGHGGNKQLMSLIAQDINYARNFQLTILRTLPRTLTLGEVVSYEILYKRKLGSRAFGLNSN